jgi:tRNA nucleotidyltransferase (CCA-adding enzyme)
VWNLLVEVCEVAQVRGWQLYLVGGVVRDAARLVIQPDTPLALPPQLNLVDLDLVVESDAPATLGGVAVDLARSLHALHPQASLEIHGKFQTATLSWENHPALQTLSLDLATARTETYAYPAANPTVQPSSVQADLYRRDFTINAMALRLTTPHLGELLDPCHGMIDLQAGQIRVLHDHSVIDDPTRIYRAVRFSSRFGFHLAPSTEAQIRSAIACGVYLQARQQAIECDRPIPALQTRLKAELKILFHTPTWYRSLQQLADLGALHCIHPSLVADRSLWQRLRWAAWIVAHRSAPSIAKIASLCPEWGNAPWLFLMEVLLTQVEPTARQSVAEGFQLPVASGQRLAQLAALEQQLAQQLPTYQKPSQIVQMLNPYDEALLMLVALRSRRLQRRAIWRYVTQWRNVKPLLDGKALKTMGYKPGPSFKQILQHLTAATLDGEIRTPAEAKIFLQTRYPQTG